MSLDTARARAGILARIRSHQGRGAAVTDSERGAVADYLQRHPAGPRPQLEGDLRTRFRAMAERMASSVAEVATAADAPAEAARYLAAHGLPATAVGWPELAALDWAAAGLRFEPRPPRRDERDGADPTGVTGCFCALAETGTVVLLSGPDAHASTHLLPETHIALVPASRIVAGMEDAFALMRAHGELPRAVNMVSGPSRTGDIEQTIVLGAHGPYRVHLIVLTAQ